MRNSSNLLRALTILTIGTTTLAACEDTPTQTQKQTQVSKPAPTVSTEPPTPVALPAPPPVATTPTAPTIATSDSKKGDPIVVEDDDSETDSLTELMARARKALAAGETDRALKLATLAVQKAPKRSSAWNILGRAQLQAGKRKAAMTSFEKAVELNPGNSYAQNNLGLTLIYDQRYAEAAEALEEAVELDTVEGYMWNNLGMAYEHLDRLENARDAYGKAAEMENDNARDSLARLQGVKSVMRTAKVDSEPKGGHDGVEGASSHQ